MPTEASIADHFKAREESAQVQPFCANQLPEWLRDYAGELAIRYSVPQSDLALACIATVGSVVGSRAKVELGWGAQATGSNLLVVLRSEQSSNLREAVQHIVEPVVNRQREILSRGGQFNDFKLEKKLEIQPHKRRLGWLTDTDLRKYLAETGNLLRTAKPALLLGRLDWESIIHALSQSVSGTLFMCNESAGQGNPCPMEGGDSLDLELVERCLDRLPIIESVGRSKVKIGEPSLGGVLVTSSPGLADWFTQFDASPVLGSSLLLLRSPAKPALINTAALEAVSLQQRWTMQIRGLMDCWNPQGFPMRLSRQGLLTLFGFHNELHKLTSRMWHPAPGIFTAPYQLATRLMIGLLSAGSENRPGMGTSN